MELNFDDDGNCYLNGGAKLIYPNGDQTLAPMVKLNLTLESLREALEANEKFTRTWDSKKYGKSFTDVTVFAVPRRNNEGYNDTHFLKLMGPLEEKKTIKAAPSPREKRKHF